MNFNDNVVVGASGAAPHQEFFRMQFVLHNVYKYFPTTKQGI